MNALRSFWAFTRPHTIIGSAISVTALAWMARGLDFLGSGVFGLSLLSALACNVFITGYNQVVDVGLDRKNKPDLPLASGALSMRSGKIIVWSALALSLTSAAWVSRFLFVLVGGIAVLGFLYSWKGVFLKKHHATAAMAITLVRGVLVNIGFYLHFAGFTQLALLPDAIWLLAVFISLFSLGIAWFKDIPDMAGDAEASIGTLALKAGATRAFKLGTYTVATGYLIGAFAPFVFAFANISGGILTIGHTLLGGLFLTFASRTNPSVQSDIQRFYKLFWVLFFAEYVLFVLAVAVQ